MTDDIDYPREYNEFVEFVERNDVSVVARKLSENYVPVEDLESLVGEFDRHDYLTSVDCASRLRMVMDRHRSGGND